MKTLFFASFIIVLAVVAVYGGTLHYPFVFDDSHAIVNNPYITSLGHIPEYFIRTAENAARIHHSGYRPLWYLSLAVNYALGGLYTTGYHVFNIAVHIANSVLVFIIALALLDKRVDYPGMAALFAGLLFALHPLQTESVTYTSSRSASMAAFFYLSAFYVYLRSREGYRLTIAAVALLLILALLSKENAVSLPAVLLLYGLSFRRGRQPYRPVVVTALVVCVYTAFRFYIAGLNPGQTFPRGLTTHWMTEAYVVPMYILRVFFPSSLNMDHYIIPVGSVSDPRFFVSVIFLFALAYALYRLFRYDRLAGFLAAWFFITISPETMVPIADFMAERRTYLPIAGVTILGGYLAGRLGAGRPARARAVIGICTATLVFLGVATLSRNSAWSSEMSIWEDTVVKSPDSPRAYLGLGHIKLIQGDKPGAESAVRKALQLDPANADAVYNMGKIFAAEGRADEALRYIRDSCEKNPGDYVYAAGLARQLAAMDRLDEAAAIFNRAVRLQPDAFEAHMGLGELYLDTGSYDKATAELEKAVELEPHSTESRMALGGAYYRLGKYDKAAEQSGEAVRLGPDDADAHFDYSLALAGTGDKTRALSEYGIYRDLSLRKDKRAELKPPPD